MTGKFQPCSKSASEVILLSSSKVKVSIIVVPENQTLRSSPRKGRLARFRIDSPRKRTTGRWPIPRHGPQRGLRNQISHRKSHGTNQDTARTTAVDGAVLDDRHRLSGGRNQRQGILSRSGSGARCR